MDEQTKATLKIVVAELASLPEKEFRKELEKHCNSEIARAYTLQDFSEPMRETPTKGIQYWIPDPTSPTFVMNSTWTDAPFDYHRLRVGIVHATVEAAKAHSLAWLSFTDKD